MSNQTCPFESAVIAAIRGDRWTGELRSHAHSCPHCRETVLVASTMHRVAEEKISEVRVPVSYRVLLLRAQFTRKQAKLSTLDLVMLLGSLGITLAGVVCITLWKWQLVRAWFAGVSPDGGSNLPLYILIGSAALIWFLTDELFLSDE